MVRWAGGVKKSDCKVEECGAEGREGEEGDCEEEGEMEEGDGVGGEEGGPELTARKVSPEPSASLLVRTGVCAYKNPCWSYHSHKQSELE